MGNGIFEVLFETTSLPSKSRLKVLRVNEDSVYLVNELPSFSINPKNLDGDNNLEAGGHWFDFELVGKKNDLIGYNPLMIYEFTKKGVEIDSVLTVNFNNATYGDFHRNRYRNDILFVSEKIEEMKNLINKLKLE